MHFGALEAKATRIYVVAVAYGTLRRFLERHQDRLAVRRKGASNRSERSTTGAPHAGISFSVCISGRRTSFEIIERAPAGHPVEWFAGTARLRGPPQWSGISVCGDHFRGSPA